MRVYLLFYFSFIILFSNNKVEAKNFTYNRANYKHWVDADKDCQDTRAEVLIRTSIEEVTFKSNKKCVVVTGFWFDPYSGEVVVEAKKLDIDHIIPLKAAHNLGAAQWTSHQRQEFANDFENLIPVQARLNRQKGAKGPWEWLPPNPSFSCDYLSLWERLSKKYGLKKSYTSNQWIVLKEKHKYCDVKIRQPAFKK